MHRQSVILRPAVNFLTRSAKRAGASPALRNLAREVRAARQPRRAKNSTTMKAILTGLGGRGLYWLDNARRHQNVEVVGFVEPYEGSISRAVNEYQVARDLIFPSLDAAIANSDADFILDVTPPAVHPEIAFKAFENGLHVIGEKPLSDNFEIARKVAQAGQAAGLTHMITQNYRFGALPRTSRRVLDEGLIGKPGQCDIKFYMNWADLPGSHYVTEPYMLINDMMVHHFDLMRYVLNEDPVSVRAVTWNQPWGWHAGDACHSITFRFASGLVATHVANGAAVGSRTSYNGDWRIEGDQGSLDWKGDKLSYSHLHRTDKNVDAREIKLDATAPQDQAMLDEFFAAIEGNRAPECNAQDNLKSLAMVFAAIQSAKENREVQLSELM